MTLEDAIHVFVHGFSLCKSRAHPYLAERVDGMWVMRDGPGRKALRKVEVVTTGLAAEDVFGRIRRAKLGWHFVCDVHSVDADYDAIRTSYKSCGYRALSTEWMFVNNLSHVPQFESEPPARQVFTQAEANAISQVASHKTKLVPTSRQFAVWDESRDYGWVRSVPVGPDAWLADLHVHRDVRKRGYGRSLMSALLRADKANGIRCSVLLASSDGARLYPHLGYAKIAVLQMFCPSKRDPGKALP